MSEPPTNTTADLLAELGSVRRLAHSLVGDAAEDLTQEVAAIALKSPPRGGLRAWLGAVTRRQAAYWQRTRIRRQEVESQVPPRQPGEKTAAVVARLQQQRKLGVITGTHMP